MTLHKKQKGLHTWDLILHYHQCPACKRIIESREDYFYRLGEYIKEIDCPYCHHYFAIVKNVEPSVGPLFGEGTVAEVEWGER